MDTIRPARTDTYELTISGLLAKRADLFNEAERIRDRLAEIKNDIGTGPGALYPRLSETSYLGGNSRRLSCSSAWRR